MPQPVRIGVFGGTFDPIHFGHLAIAEEARLALGLSQVRFVPAARQPLKGRVMASGEQRLTMVRLACQDNPAFHVDECELRRPPPSYTSVTLASLRAEYGPAVQLWFILGADAARELPRWHQVEALLRHTHLAIVARPHQHVDLAALQQTLPLQPDQVVLLSGPQLAIASSQLRQRLAQGLPVRYQLPEAVRSFIEAEQLYQQHEEAHD
ncbi:nicotinate-nucleotide adenylyltransferase [Candidatus Viridilinea mediisalina]|uniref:Probable nicotinate-nucleotide adenylyltransferase n=1 Tax=Candidatus Viridilinea mediisalina TaxID=2024553 RepID=A0A2A6RDL5_9CHLR|nr:nicotinate-nucleotide adenylyltransferase [Candidatus Viridilinea mediisalina]PDV99464.1 nicotinate (nicotinamide) nucleotide adenylyltransferase [Candidatus Viridilinea mediisalina]